MSEPPEIFLPERLLSLIGACEKSCVAECCGRDAFDFSPLHVASYLSAYSGDIPAHEVEKWQGLIHEARLAAASREANADGFIGAITKMNQFFTRNDFEEMLEELANSIRVARQVVEFSDQLRRTRENLE